MVAFCQQSKSISAAFVEKETEVMRCEESPGDDVGQFLSRKIMLRSTLRHSMFLVQVGQGELRCQSGEISNDLACFQSLCSSSLVCLVSNLCVVRDRGSVGRDFE